MVLEVDTYLFSYILAHQELNPKVQKLFEILFHLRDVNYALFTDLSRYICSYGTLESKTFVQYIA